MPLRSQKTVKVTEIPTGINRGQFQDFVTHLCTQTRKEGSKSRFPFLKSSKLKASATATANPRVRSCHGETSDQAYQQEDTFLLSTTEWSKETFASQSGYSVGTISFNSKESKEAAIRCHQKDKDSPWKEWNLIDKFDHLTVLYDAGSESEVDICAVHGLGGNAIDTWTTAKNKMWLRDFLPVSEYFAKSRIMTFGYDSDLTDRRSVMRIENWADSLLDSVNQVRSSDKEKSRPILFVCHSLGGLVTRKAMTKLPNSYFGGISLVNCGIVFLATPHTGSTNADWSNFLTAVAHTVAGVRPETVAALESFSTDSVWDKEAFFNLKPRPPHFRCLAEGRKMRVAGTDQHVVTQSSASLDSGKPAVMIMDADHSSICKFDSNLGPFGTVISALNAVLTEIKNSDTDTNEPNRIPGHPHFIAHAYPPDKDYWWEGNQINEISYRLTSEKTIFGRDKELSDLVALVSRSASIRKLTAVKGIGGIGKTELLVEFVAKQKGRRNVFLLRAKESNTFENTLGEIAMNIGFDMIEDPKFNRELWRVKSISERVQIFLDWLGHSCNKEALLLVDDLDAFELHDVQNIFRSPAQNIVVSTRDSNLERTLEARLDIDGIRLQPLDDKSIISVMECELKGSERDTFTTPDLVRIAGAISGHPLSARLAIPFIIDRLATYDKPVDEFLQLLRSSDPSERASFFKYKLDGICLWDCFELSYRRLCREDEGSAAAVALMQLLPFLRTDNDCIDKLFKLKKPWLKKLEKDLPDASILKESYPVISGWLSRLRKVSFYLNTSSSNRDKILNIHPLIYQFVLLRAGEQGRVRFLEQIFRLCYEVAMRDETGHSLVEPHIQHCLSICDEFDIELSQLKLPTGVYEWIRRLWLDLDSEQDQEEEDDHHDEEGDHHHQEEENDHLENPFDDPTVWIDNAVQDLIKTSTDARSWFDDAERVGCKDNMMQVVIKPVKSFKKLQSYLEDEYINWAELPVEELKRAVVDLAIMVKRVSQEGGNVYPDLLLNLQDFVSNLIDRETLPP